MYITDIPALTEMIKKSKGKKFLFDETANLKEMGLLFWNSYIRKRYDPNSDEEDSEYDKEKEKDVVYNPYITKEGNFGRDGRFLQIVMEDNDKPIYSRNFREDIIVYTDLQLIDMIKSQTTKNRIYSRFKNVQAIIRSRNYTKLLDASSKLCIRIINNYKKYTSKNIKTGQVYGFLEAIDGLFNVFLHAFAYNKDISFMYYKGIQEALGKMYSRFEKIRDISMGLDTENPDKRNQFFLNLFRKLDSLMAKYYAIYHKQMPPKELADSIKYVNLDFFVEYIFPNISLPNDKLAKLINEKVKSIIEAKVARAICNVTCIPPSILKSIQCEVNIKDLESGVLLLSVDNDTISDISKKYIDSDSCCDGSSDVGW